MTTIRICDELALAAAELRRRAAAAATDLDERSGPRDQRPAGDRWSNLALNYLGDAMGEHCSAFTPAVALAIADWLDIGANQYACADREPMLAVAHAYLQRPADTEYVFFSRQVATAEPVWPQDRATDITVEAGGEPAAAVAWDDLQVGRIVRYEQMNRTRRLAGKPPTVRRGRLVRVTPPAEKVHGQITVEVLNKDGSINASLGRVSTWLNRIVSIEPAEGQAGGDHA